MDFITLLLGWMSGIVGVNFFTSPSSSLLNNKKKWLDFEPTSETLKMIRMAEWGLKSPHYKPYKDNRWTIGFGTVSIYLDNGSYYRDIKSTDTLPALKRELNKSFLSDLDFCFLLMKNHLKRGNGYKVIAKLLDSASIPFHESLANSLYDFSYHSGGAFSNGSRNVFFVNSLKSNIGNLSFYASAYINLRLSYQTQTNGYKDYPLNFLTRSIWSAENVKNIKNPIDYYRTKFKSISLVKTYIFENFNYRVI